jgi:hypothetical protein
MSDIYWIISFVVGYLIGRMHVPDNNNINEDLLEEHRKKFDEDIAYYKKLTRNLVEENKEFRKKINES